MPRQHDGDLNLLMIGVALRHSVAAVLGSATATTLLLLSACVMKPTMTFLQNNQYTV